MDLYYAGAEQPIYLNQLRSYGVDHIAISFYEWQRRHSTDDLYDHVPRDMKVCITAGVARKEDIDWDSFGQDYVEFCQRNSDQALLYDMDAPQAPLSVRREIRNQLSMLPNMVAFPIDDEDVGALCTVHERLGINATMAKALPASELRRLPAALYGSNITDPRTLKTARFTATTSFAWMSGRRYGELWVFARNKLFHYPAENLTKATRAHADDITSLGVDPLAVAANDKDALTEIAVMSLQAMAQTLTMRPRDRQTVEVAAASGQTGSNDLVAAGGTGGAALVAPNGVRDLNARETITLPVISVSAQEDGLIITSTNESLRQCDSCYLSHVCPKFETHAACAFNIPVEIKTDAQWESASGVIMEWQFKRLSFAVMAEEMEGGGMSPRTGQEMDRWFKMLSSVKDLKAPVIPTGAGALSKVFGPPPEGAQVSLGDGNDRAQEEASEEDDVDWQEADLVGPAGEGEYADDWPADIEEEPAPEGDPDGQDGGPGANEAGPQLGGRVTP